jgi:hypothetical protein
MMAAGRRLTSGAEARMQEPQRSANSESRRHSRVPFDDAVKMGVVYYVLIVGMIVLASAERYRFFYGNF